jgi:Carboxypeptidase regulatory-like domain
MKFLIPSAPHPACRRKAVPVQLLGMFLCFVCALTPLALAQTPLGSIVGKVSEWHGGPLAGARVTVTNAQTHKAASVATDVNGEFTVENLRVGDYEVTIAASGLVPAHKDVKVKPGHKSKLSIALRPPAPPTPAAPPK